jgi:hypothetical protein
MTHAQKHTHLQTAPTPPADQSLQKSVFLPTQKRILFFSPSLRCFNFFATHYRHINNSTHTVKVFINKHFQTRWTRTPAANMRLASCGVTCLNSSSVFQFNFSAGLTVLCPEIPHERQAQKRYHQC